MTAMNIKQCNFKKIFRGKLLVAVTIYESDGVQNREIKFQKSEIVQRHFIASITLLRSLFEGFAYILLYPFRIGSYSLSSIHYVTV